MIAESDMMKLNVRKNIINRFIRLKKRRMPFLKRHSPYWIFSALMVDDSAKIDFLHKYSLNMS